MADPPEPTNEQPPVTNHDFHLPQFTLATDLAVVPSRSSTGPLAAVRKRRRSVSRISKRAAVTVVHANDGLVASPAVGPTLKNIPILAQETTEPSRTFLPDSDLPLHAIPSDTQVALTTLRSQWPGEGVDELAKLPPIVLLSQIYALVADRVAVDRHIEQMRASNILRFIRLPPGTPSDYAIVLTADLHNSAARSSHLDDRVLHLFFDQLLPECTDIGVTQAQLDLVLGTVVADAASVLVRSGLITMRDEHSFWFSIPYAGYFVKVRERGNKELLGILRRAPFREMLLVKLELRRLRSTVFPAIFHIRDVIGSNTAETVNTTLGKLVRLRTGLEDPLASN